MTKVTIAYVVWCHICNIVFINLYVNICNIDRCQEGILLNVNNAECWGFGKFLCVFFQ